jgi:glycosyltransferase involved in cell wall biosynthesis
LKGSMDLAAPPIRVLIATPLGIGGMGGIDRLTDVILAELERRPGLRVCARRLITRGPLLISSPLVFTRAIWQLWVAGRRGEVDLIHIHLSKQGSSVRKAVLARVARRLKIPYVVHPHADGRVFGRFWSLVGSGPRYAFDLLATEARSGEISLRSQLRTVLWSTLTGFGREIDQLFRRSARILVLGHDWKQLISSRLDGTGDNITVVPNATRSPDPRPPPPRRDYVQISFLGEIGERKGVRPLIRALAKLAPQTQWMATLAGNGRTADAAALCAELGVADRITIPGWLDAEHCAELLWQTDIFVLPSLAENLPMAILEAFAFGKAVITTPVGSVPEVVYHQRNGLLVPPGDVEALAAALDRLINDPDLRTRLGNAARQDHAERYDVSPYVTRLTTIWRQAIESADTSGFRRPPSRQKGRLAALD